MHGGSTPQFSDGNSRSHADDRPRQESLSEITVVWADNAANKDPSHL